MERLRKEGLGLATVTYDPVEVLDGFSRQHGITFPMLADVGSVTIKKFGILNPVPEWALGPDKDDPAVQAEVQKYVSVVPPNCRDDWHRLPRHIHFGPPRPRQTALL